MILRAHEVRLEVEWILRKIALPQVNTKTYEVDYLQKYSI